MQQYDVITKAKSSMVLKHPFFATLLLSRPIYEDDSIPTAATNGLCIKYNKKFIDSLNSREVMGILAHELLHIALFHPFRRKDRDPKIWNYAGDYVINLDLIASGFVLPEGGLYDEKYKNMSTEQVYRAIYNDAKQNPDKYSGGDLDGDVEPVPGDAAERAAGEQMVRVDVNRALAVAKQAGKLPASLSKQIVESIAEQHDWREQLRAFMTEPLKDNQSWNRGQRRFLHQNLYLPAVYSLGLGVVALILDTSGSVYNDAPKFLGETSSISEDCKPKAMVLIQVDSKVQNVEWYEPGQQLKQTVSGGGGTNLCRGFEYIEKEGIDPALCIVLTDLETPFPKTIPDYPVLWVSVCRGEAPFGEVIYM